MGAGIGFLSGLTGTGGGIFLTPLLLFCRWASIPDELPAEEAGPFMCAGVTVYNALRNSGARGGDVVAVHGIGGLRHLGVQYARQMGFKTVALGRGKDKEPLAKKLGAHHYIDSGTGDVAAELQKLGGANVILATAPNAQAISALVDVFMHRL
jgi:D-arabinose 1-dehydrogenase-like Zn-dependent alcohol dehydrogenase